jgi:UDP-glucose 4-epimerase
MKVMVTGGAGFVGSHIVDEAIRAGHEVVVLDNLASGSRENLHPQAKFYELSITDPQVKEILRSEGVEAICHQAAQVGVPASIEEPLHDAQTNIIGTLHLLEAARELKLKKFVYASSAAIYGAPEYLPVDEDHPLRPMSPYGLSKKVAEAYVHLYGELYGLSGVSFRYGNIYGPRQTFGEGSVVPVFMMRMLTGREVQIHGDGNQTRDLVYVGDVARANVMALTSEVTGSFNVSTQTTLTINELFRLLVEETGYDKSPVHTAPRPGDIYHSCLKNEKLIEALGWRPEMDLREGLKKTVEWGRVQGWKA